MTATQDLRRAVERLERLADDDRFRRASEDDAGQLAQLLARLQVVVTKTE